MIVACVRVVFGFGYVSLLDENSAYAMIA